MVVSWGSWFNSILKQIGINLYASNWIFLCEVSLNMYIFFLAAFMCVLCCDYKDFVLNGWLLLKQMFFLLPGVGFNFLFFKFVKKSDF